MTHRLSGAYRLGNRLRTLSIVLPALLGLLATGSVQAQAPAPRLSVDSEIASAGFFHLSWDADTEDVELQEADNPSFQNPGLFYTGPDRATVISGKPDGTWYYRVRASTGSQTGPWSEPVAVVVAHHSLSRALMVLSVGVIVFVATVLVIVRGPGKAE